MISGKKRWLLKSKIVFLPLLFLSCSTMADYDFSAVDSSVSAAQYAAVYDHVEKNSKKIYSKHDDVLRLIDLGLLSHFAGEMERSNSELENAEKMIEVLSASSITQSIGSVLINDTVKDYSGESYEDIYINIFKCLNYLCLGQTEDAFVEIRRFDNKLRDLIVNSQAVIESAKKQLSSGSDLVPAANMKFHNSAFARYLSMIMYRAEEKTDDMRIDYDKIKEAFSLQSDIYNFPVPSCIDGEFGLDSGRARLNIICFSGLAPIKEENTIELPLGVTYYKLALPQMVKRKSHIAFAKVTVTSSADGSSYTATPEKIESIEDIALDTYQRNYALSFAHSLARSIAKATTTAVLDVGAQQTDSTVLSILSMFSALATDVTERADVRTSRYFPATISVTGFTLEPGFYDVAVIYYASDGSQVAQYDFLHTLVSEKNVNIIESFCQN